MKRVQKPKPKTARKLKTRGSWGSVNPVTKIEKDKRKYNRKQKHKGKEEDE